MKRYDLYIYTEGAELKEEPDGNYVKWEDVQEKIRELIDNDAFQKMYVNSIEQEFEL